MRSLIVATLSLFMLTCQAASAEETAETWQCTDFAGGEPRVVARSSFESPEGLGTGQLEVAGAVRNATFFFRGLSRLWAIRSEEAVLYAFEIQPDGKGLYYDFTGTPSGTKTSPSLRLACVKV